MICNVKPVTDVQPIAVNRNWFSDDGVQDDQWNQFLRKLEWAVIVGAVRGKHGHSVGVVISADQMVGGSFGRRIWAIRCVARRLAKRGIVGVKRAVNFVS